MTPLAARLGRRIASAGPLTLAEYMADCLLDPDHGYYATRDPFGAAGDFTTAPEVSQMFGELVGLALAQAWLDQGAPTPFLLAEPGPGRGTLMADILRATRRVPGFHQGARIHLIEASAHLRKVQAQRLEGHSPVWLDAIADLPGDLPLFLVANEFFDALPIRQFTRRGKAWAERLVGLRDGALAWGLADPAPVPALEHRLADTGEGDVVELCPGAGPIMAQISARLLRNGGAALIIDYGGWRSRGDTFQALAQHGFVDPLAAPGEADLTAHVDFEALARAAPGLRIGGPLAQGMFLQSLGIAQRAEVLARNLQGEALQSHRAALNRLTHPAAMGNLFKVMGLAPPGLAMVPGLTDATEKDFRRVDPSHEAQCHVP